VSGCFLSSDPLLSPHGADNSGASADALLSPLTHSTTDKLSAQAFLTFTVTKTGAARLSLAPTYFSEERVKSDVTISDALKATLAKPLKAKPAKKKAAKVEEKAE